MERVLRRALFLRNAPFLRAHSVITAKIQYHLTGKHNNLALNLKRDIHMLDSIKKSLNQMFWVWNDATNALLQNVLDGDAKNAIAICNVSPKRLFLPASGFTEAAGIGTDGLAVHRKIASSPYCVALAEGDLFLLCQIHDNYMDIMVRNGPDAPMQMGYKLMAEQFDAQFPDGVEFPECNYDFFFPLVDAIFQDRDLLSKGVANRETENEIIRFRQAQLHNITKKGHHSPLSEMKAACKVLQDQWSNWNDHQRLFFYVKVIGYFQRLLSKADASALCSGYEHLKERTRAPNQNFKIVNKKNPEQEHLYFPLDNDAYFRLGVDFALSVEPHCAAVKTLKHQEPQQLSELMEMIFTSDKCDSAENLAKIYSLAKINNDLLDMLDQLMSQKVSVLKNLRRYCEPEASRYRLLEKLTSCCHYPCDYPNGIQAEKIYSIMPDLMFERIAGESTPIEYLFGRYAMNALLGFVEHSANNYDLVKRALNSFQKHNRDSTRYSYDGAYKAHYNRLEGFFQLIDLILSHRMKTYGGEHKVDLMSTSIKKIVELFRDPETTDKQIQNCIYERKLVGPNWVRLEDRPVYHYKPEREPRFVSGRI